MSNFTKLLKANVAHMTEEERVRSIYTDYLTGIWNRRALEMHPLFEADIAYVALIDLDSLKWINDTHGHAAGDQAIRQLGQALNRAFPDRAFRISGDEFVVIDTDRERLERRLNRGTRFSYAIGKTLSEADSALALSKLERTTRGLRVERGETPVWARRTNR